MSWQRGASAILFRGVVSLNQWRRVVGFLGLQMEDPTGEGGQAGFVGMTGGDRGCRDTPDAGRGCLHEL